MRLSRLWSQPRSVREEKNLHLQQFMPKAKLLFIIFRLFEIVCILLVQTQHKITCDTYVKILRLKLSSFNPPVCAFNTIHFILLSTLKLFNSESVHTNRTIQSS
jgi:hypothetical protein